MAVAMAADGFQLPPKMRPNVDAATTTSAVAMAGSGSTRKAESRRVAIMSVEAQMWW